MLNIVMLGAMAAMFGFNPVAGRALAGVIEPGQLSLVRWVAAGGIVLALALARGNRERWHTPLGTWLTLIGIGALGMGFCSYAAYAGTKTTNPTNVSLIYATTSAFVLAMEWALRQSRASTLLVSGVVVCLLGAAVIITKGRPDALASMTFTIGDLWSLAGTIGWAVYTLLLKRTPTSLTPFAMFVATAIGGILFCLPVAILETVAVGWHLPSPRDATWIASMILLCGVGAYLAYNWCIVHVGPVLTSAALTLNPLATALLGALLVGETLAAFHAVGGALVVSGLALINVDKARARRP